MNFKKRESLTKDTILNKINPYDVYKYYIPDMEINRAIHSPLRVGDTNPSFRVGISSKTGEYMHMDYSREELKGNCFDFVMQLKGCNLDEALHIIDTDFNLGISGKSVHKRNVISWEIPKIKKKESIITYETQPFTSNEIKYLNAHGILDIKDTFSAKKVFYNGNEIQLRRDLCEDVAFIYKYGEYTKTYRPLCKDRKYRFVPNNVPITTIDGIIKECDTLLISKSRKDYNVINKVFSNVIALQNESLVSLSEENEILIKEKVKRPIIFFDGDDPGIEAAKKLSERTGFEYIFLEGNCKDPAKLILEFGYDALVEFLKNKKII